MSHQKVETNLFIGGFFLLIASLSIFYCVISPTVFSKGIWLAIATIEISISFINFYFAGCHMIISEMRKMQNIQVLDKLPSSDLDPGSEPITDTPE